MTEVRLDLLILHSTTRILRFCALCHSRRPSAEHTGRAQEHLPELPGQMCVLSKLTQVIDERRKNQHVRASGRLLGADRTRVRPAQVHDGTRLRRVLRAPLRRTGGSRQHLPPGDGARYRAVEPYSSLDATTTARAERYVAFITVI